MKILLSDYDEKTQKDILEMYDNYQFLKSYGFDRLFRIFIYTGIFNEFMKLLRKEMPTRILNSLSTTNDKFYNFFGNKAFYNRPYNYRKIRILMGDNFKHNFFEDYKKIIKNYIKEENLKITKTILDILFINDISNYIFSYLK